jgi:prephenate dehydrogenase
MAAPKGGPHMKNVTAGIIGGTHGMGRWFASFLQKEGCVVHVWGRKTAMSIDELAGLCNVVVVAVPISATAAMIKKVGPLLREDMLLMDLTSLKKEPVELMEANTRAEVIGCHPLFGPTLTDAAGQNVVLCPIRRGRWLSWLKRILQKNGLAIIESNPEEHDKMMAIVQALNHFNTITLGRVIAETGIPLSAVNKFSTPLFRTKMEIVKKVFTEGPQLYSDIISKNPAIDEILDLYEKALADIRRLIKQGDTAGLKESIEQAAKKIF